MPRFYSNVVRPSSNKTADPGKEKKGNAGKGKDDKDPAGDGKKEEGGGE